MASKNRKSLLVLAVLAVFICVSVFGVKLTVQRKAQAKVDAVFAGWETFCDIEYDKVNTSLMRQSVSIEDVKLSSPFLGGSIGSVRISDYKPGIEVQLPNGQTRPIPESMDVSFEEIAVPVTKNLESLSNNPLVADELFQEINSVVESLDLGDEIVINYNITSNSDFEKNEHFLNASLDFEGVFQFTEEVKVSGFDIAKFLVKAKKLQDQGVKNQMPHSEMLEIALEHISFELINETLIDKIFAAAAKQANQTPEVLRQQASAQIVNAQPGANAPDIARQLSIALLEMINGDRKRLKISASPQSAVRIEELVNAQNVEEAVEKLSLSIN
ncbi:hypothetical protein [Sedimentisphaera salicampi]|uniref:Uncharacterized protein n=1 Tax=Sedimentisphaera salicampi TaxID=1941349 RepID=A0A1W6LJG7_9BACT|nr:hypothetical protein [Sedimentisphaera salicampi]ARN55884.1 hypothetical protein STSP1_00251 [Sedimentisphaera salicampi]OXU16075.1 hypothetical protein SMSP1_00244 [Sedimentisphaera salicampi]